MNIKPSPWILDEVQKKWIFEKIREGVCCPTQLIKLCESEESRIDGPGRSGLIFRFLNIAVEKWLNLNELRSLSDEDLRQVIDRKAVEYDIEVQRGILDDFLSDEDDLGRGLYFMEQALDLLKEVSQTVDSTEKNQEILAKINAYLELANWS